MPSRRDFFLSSVGALATLGLADGSVGRTAAAEATHARGAGPSGQYAAQLEAMRQKTNVTGASFAYWDGKQLHTAAAGARNSVTGDPVTVDTVMHVGSITKVVNAALLMQLVDEGRITLESPVLEHLPDLRLGDMAAARRITCGMLVNHTSGIDGAWLPEYGPDQERIIDTIDRCAALGQLFAPGTETSYNNIATVIAGYLIQRLRAKSWYTLVKEHIYQPLGMGHALVDPLDVPRFRASVGDLTDRATGALVQTTRPFLATSLAPAGTTQMTSASDIVLFARTLMNDGVGPNGARILSAESARRMASPTAAFAPIGNWSEHVGLGWMILPSGVLSHGGSGPGVRAKLYAHPPSGKAMALLTNCDRGDRLIEAFIDPIMQAWTDERPAPPPQVDSTPIDPDRYVGVYEDVADRYIIDRHEAGLTLRTGDKFMTYDNSSERNPPIFLESLGDDTFRGRALSPGSDDQTIRFLRPDTNKRMQFVSSWGKLMARTR